MCQYKEVIWELVPQSLPTVSRSCSKCGNQARFINSKKFRVNANKNQVDIWLIYQCEACKTTWNMSIYERINPKSLAPREYLRFSENDPLLAEYYGFDVGIHRQNGVSLNLAEVDYALTADGDIRVGSARPYRVTVKCPFPAVLRMDRLISMGLGISRSQVKKYVSAGRVKGCDGSDLLKSKVRDGAIFIVNM